MTFDDIVKEAFLDEMRNIYFARGQEMPKLAFDQRIDAMIKEAKFLQAIKDVAGKAAKKVHRTVTPKGRQLAKYEDAGVGGVAEKAMKETGGLRRAEQWGKKQRMSPTQRMTADRRASTNPLEKSMLQVKGDKASKLKQIADVNKATQQIGGTSRAGRTIGAAVEGGAAHVRHHPIRTALNPLGVPLGGAIEGATRQTGRELVSAGHKGVGRAFKRHAGKAGFAGEVGTLAGLGTAVHAPLSAAGVVGGKITGGAAGLAPAAADALSHAAAPIGHAADVALHGAQDVIGHGVRKAAPLLGKGVAMAKSVGSRLIGRAPQVLGA